MSQVTPPTPLPKKRRRRVPSKKQQRRDRYYMTLAKAVEAGANCTGSQVGAVIVLGDDRLGDRVVATGYNGTPAGFKNCVDGGCVRCARRRAATVKSGEGLDWCICVHAEQNALLTAARFGISVQGATLYSTVQPCFGCLKEAIQAGVERIVYMQEYPPHGDREVVGQYRDLVTHLGAFDQSDALVELVQKPAA